MCSGVGDKASHVYLERGTIVRPCCVACAVQGRAVQVDPGKPVLKAPGTMRLKLKYGRLLSSFAFMSNFRRYIKANQPPLFVMVTVGPSQNFAIARHVTGCRLTQQLRVHNACRRRGGRCRRGPGRRGRTICTQRAPTRRPARGTGVVVSKRSPDVGSPPPPPPIVCMKYCIHPEVTRLPSKSCSDISWSASCH